MKLEKIDSIKVFGKTYKIVYVREDNYDLLEGKYGKVSYQTQTIYLDSTLAGEQGIDNIFHELFHIISSDLNLGFDEKVVCQLACGMTDFIINNSRKLIFTSEDK